MSNNVLISLVVPCYNEEESLPLFYSETCKAADTLRQDFKAEIEFIFVDDGSKDNTLSLNYVVFVIKTVGYIMFHSHVISEKNQHYMPG